jgi:hypothetical protein
VTEFAVRKIYENGRHNAFTHLVDWRGALYLVFRTGDHHVSPDGAITVLRSEDDGLNWDEVASLSGPPGLDMRDPHLVAAPDRLFLHSFSLHQRTEKNAWVCQSSDGVHWTPFARALPHQDNRVIWWPVYHDGRFYGAGYRYDAVKSNIRTIFLQSADGVLWQEVSVVHDAPWSNEASMLFESDGTATVLVRNETPPKLPVLAQSKPPFTSWQVVTLPEVIQGLAIHRLPYCYLIAGRVFQDGSPRTAVLTWNGRELAYRHILSSGGDTAYPGLVQKGDRMFMSYYSSHEHPHQPGQAVVQSDIYFATFAVPD